MEPPGEFLMHLDKQVRADGGDVAEQVKTACVRPLLLAPARKAEHKRHVRQLDRVEARKAATFEVDVHARCKRQQWLDKGEPSPAPGADDARLGIIVRGAAQPYLMFPRLEHDARVF